MKDSDGRGGSIGFLPQYWGTCSCPASTAPWAARPLLLRGEVSLCPRGWPHLSLLLPQPPVSWPFVFICSFLSLSFFLPPFLSSFTHLFIFAALGTEPRVFSLTYTASPRLLFILYLYYFWSQGPAKLSRLNLNLCSCCLSTQSAGITVVHHHAQLRLIFNAFIGVCWLFCFP